MTEKPHLRLYSECPMCQSMATTMLGEGDNDRHYQEPYMLERRYCHHCECVFVEKFVHFASGVGIVVTDEDNRVATVERQGAQQSIELGHATVDVANHVEMTHGE